ncbi:flagellar hook-length control protein FliK [Legionella drancourtii]|uniref:Flagellar hook-length control protein-like C-terminal domain-containing protein n=1 Tax=Legionella drancourtii LLAP12 TaxID=658187 RepID=G9EUL1_9GAMM|nr:flagellar hook-length control protein FliK [Legionella drancourtii]EHL29011.1 hypothetical protein LDG_9009 [Legionella drancourtii LLAP12]
MLDTNNVTLSSLLNLSSQDSTGTEQLSALKEEPKQDDDGLIDPNTFVLLFAQITENIPVSEQQETQVFDAANLIDAEPVTSEKSQNEQITAVLEDNVAVAWINSDYYQSEINADSTDASPAWRDVSEDASAKQIELNSGNEQNGVLNDPLNWEWLETQSIPALSENVKITDSTSQKSYDEQILKTNASINLTENNRLIRANQETRYAEQFAPAQANNEVGFLEIQSSIDAFSFVNEQGILEDNEQNNILFQPALAEIKNNDLARDDYLIAEEEVLDIETTVPGKSKSSLLSEMQTRTSIIDRVKTVQQPTLDSTIFNQVSNNISHLVSERHENDEFQLSTPQSFTIPTDVDHPEWSKHFSDQVMWLGQQGIKSAVIKLHPEDLGPLEISIKVVNDSASINIASHSQQVRDLIDQSLPRLQEMMAEHGLNLSEVNIDSDTKERQFERHENSPSADLISHLEEDAILTPIKNKAVPQGIIDYFA